MTGTIKKLLMDRGFGFIAVEGSDDIYFHADSLSDVKFEELKEGDNVSFEVTESNDGRKKAANVKRA